MCVVQDPTPQGGLRSSRIELDGASQEVVETGERLRAVDEVDDRLRLLTVDAWRDVDHRQLANELRVARREHHRSEPTQRHADDSSRVRRVRLNGTGHVVGQVGRRVRPIVAPGRMAVAGKVDSERGAAQRKRHRVPGVRVLRPTVDEDDLGGLIPPRQQAERPSVSRATERRSTVGSSGTSRPNSAMFSANSPNSSYGATAAVSGESLTTSKVLVKPCWERAADAPDRSAARSRVGPHRRPLPRLLLPPAATVAVVVVVLVVSGTAVVVVVAATVGCGRGTGHGGRTDCGFSRWWSSRRPWWWWSSTSIRSQDRAS